MADIFIVSQHRTGSTLLRNMLNAHSEISIAFDEMNIFEPLRKNTLDKLLATKIQTPEALIKAIEEKRIYGTFWKKIDVSGIDKALLLDALKKEKVLDVQTILKVVLAMLCHKYKTMHSGVKYPVNFSKSKQLKQWFPSSKMIFLTRNPKAINASKINDPATKRRKQKSFIHRFAIHYVTLLYFCFEFRASVKVYLENKEDFFKICYEDLVMEQRTTLSQLCQFCGVDFEESMLNVSGKESSHHDNETNKPITTSIEKYKTVLSKFDQLFIGLLTAKSYKKVAV